MKRPRPGDEAAHQTPDEGGVFHPGVPALDTAKHRRVQVA